MQNKLFTTLLLLVFCQVPFAQIKLETKAYLLMNPITVDGAITAAEWSGRQNITNYYFDFGTCYTQLFRDTLYLAFDITIDTHDDQNNDRLVIYKDVNNNGKMDDNLLYSSNVGARIINKLATKPDAAVYRTRQLANRVTGATYFGLSAFSATYPHRCWEVAIPLNQLGAGKIGFAFEVASTIPLTSKLIGGENGGNYLATIEVANGMASITNNLLAAVAMSSTQSADGEKTITSKIINAKGDVEITYSDGSKKILYNGGYTLITPDGKMSSASYNQTQRLVPPLPTNPDVGKFLDGVNNELFDQICRLLNNDATSIANFKKGDVALNIYQLIYRHFDFISFLNTKQ